MSSFDIGLAVGTCCVIVSVISMGIIGDSKKS